LAAITRAQRVQRCVIAIRSHRDLEAWQVAMNLVDRIYSLTERFPDKERFGLQAQLRRGAVSVPSNIAEGQARPIRAALNHLSIAVGSLAEIDTQIDLARRRNYINQADLERCCALVKSAARLTRGLARAKKRL